MHNHPHSADQPYPSPNDVWILFSKGLKEMRIISPTPSGYTRYRMLSNHEQGYQLPKDEIDRIVFDIERSRLANSIIKKAGGGKTDAWIRKIARAGHLDYIVEHVAVE